MMAFNLLRSRGGRGKSVFSKVGKSIGSFFRKPRVRDTLGYTGLATADHLTNKLSDAAIRPSPINKLNPNQENSLQGSLFRSGNIRNYNNILSTQNQRLQDANKFQTDYTTLNPFRKGLDKKQRWKAFGRNAIPVGTSALQLLLNLPAGTFSKVFSTLFRR